MLSYCLECKNDSKNVNPRVSKTINGKIMLLSRCVVCNSNKLGLIKKQDTIIKWSNIKWMIWIINKLKKLIEAGDSRYIYQTNQRKPSLSMIRFMVFIKKNRYWISIT